MQPVEPAAAHIVSASDAGRRSSGLSVGLCQIYLNGHRCLDRLLNGNTWRLVLGDLGWSISRPQVVQSSYARGLIPMSGIILKDDHQLGMIVSYGNEAIS